jgi:hypothetical protein
MKYRFEGSHADGPKIIIEFDADSIDDVLNGLKDFLRGCGFAEETVKEFLDLE